MYQIAPSSFFVQAEDGKRDHCVTVVQTCALPIFHTLEVHSDTVEAFALTCDSKYAVSGSDDNTLKVWDLESGDLIRTLEGHSDTVEAVALTCDSKYAVSGSDDNTL